MCMPLRRAAAFGQLVDLAGVGPALVGEEENVVQRAGKEQFDDLVFGAGGHALDAFAAAPLGAEGVRRHALDVGIGAEGDEHIGLGDQVLGREFAGDILDDHRPPLVAELGFEHQNVVFHQRTDLLRVGEQVLIVRDLRHDLGVLVLDLLAFQGRQAAQLQVEDGLRLHLAETEALHQARCGQPLRCPLPE